LLQDEYEYEYRPFGAEYEYEMGVIFSASTSVPRVNCPVAFPLALALVLVLGFFSRGGRTLLQDEYEYEYRPFGAEYEYEMGVTLCLPPLIPVP